MLCFVSRGEAIVRVQSTFGCEAYFYEVFRLKNLASVVE